MKKNKKIYEHLSEQYSDEEMVENFVFSEVLDAEEQQRVDEEFRQLRLQRLKEMSPQQQLLGRLMKMKMLMQDYFKIQKFLPEYSFSNQLKYYIKAIGKTHKEFAGDIGLHATKLSRILNGKENPNAELMHRLEKHSSGYLPAFYWWRLHARRLEHLLRTDLEKKLEEGEKVKNPLRLPG